MFFLECGKPSAFSDSDCKAADESMMLITAGHYAEAFMRLREHTDSKHPSVVFNLALCFCRSQNYANADILLEKALKNIKLLSAELRMVDETELLLRQIDISDECWLRPMSSAYPLLFAAEARQNFLMAAMYVAVQNGQQNKAALLAGGLTGAQFDEFKTKVLREV